MAIKGRKHCEKRKYRLLQAVSPFYMPVEDGTYYRITHGGQAGGHVDGVPHSLSVAYLQNYTSYCYETPWVDGSHEGGVHCTGIITLACLIFYLLSFVYFHT